MKQKILLLFIYLLFLVFISTFFLFCWKSPEDKEEDKNKIAMILLPIAKSITDNTGPSSNTCTSCTITSTSPPFSTVTSVATTCLSCHSGSSPSAGFDLSSYNSTILRVCIGNANQSQLFQKIQTGGSMNQYSNSELNSAILNWINGCALQ